MIVNVTRGTVSNWEAGRLRPADKYLKRLDEAWNTGGHFERLHLFASTGHDPDWYRQYLQYEGAAKIIRCTTGRQSRPCRRQRHTPRRSSRRPVAALLTRMKRGELGL